MCIRWLVNTEQHKDKSLVLESIRRLLKVVQSLLLCLLSVRLPVLFSAGQMSSFSGITATSHVGTARVNNMHTLCGQAQQRSAFLQARHLHLKQLEEKPQTECRLGLPSSMKKDYLLHRPRDCISSFAHAAKESSGAIWSPSVCWAKHDECLLDQMCGGGSLLLACTMLSCTKSHYINRPEG